MPAQKYEKVPSSVENSSSRFTDDDNDAHSSNQKLNATETGTIMPITNLPTTNSSQQLVGGDSESVSASLGASSTIDDQAASTASLNTTKRPSSRNSQQYLGFAGITYQEWFTVGVLCFVNLINYMDRFTIAGKIKFEFFHLTFCFAIKLPGDDDDTILLSLYGYFALRSTQYNS